ncbi:MAG TPA: DUF2884 family protein [Rhodanobacter sp.]|nr:DUF2884 family protein [Rhodanobacter sp.]
MRPRLFYSSLLLGLLSLGVGVPLQAQDLAATCHASSSYDLTLQPRQLVFERATPGPTRVVIGAGTLGVDGVLVHGAGEQPDQVRAFERELRALVPQVRAVATRGVDLATQSVRDEVAGLGLDNASRDELDSHLAAHASTVKQRIATSQSTKDWHGSALEQYAADLSADLLPTIGADLGQQALQAMAGGDAQGALALRDKAVGLATGLQARMRQQLQALRPAVAALCPSVQRLLELQQGWKDAQGRPLQLLERNP